MPRATNLRILTSLLVLAMATAAPSALAEAAGAAPGTTAPVFVGWTCDRADNICGLDDPKMLSKPAKVDWDALYKATPEYKKIRDDKIDPNSSEGIQLRQRAADRIRDKAEQYRSQNGYCSVWKSIRHSDGRAVPDITDQVKALL